MNKEMPLKDRLSSAVNSMAFLSNLQLSIYASILTINSILIGAIGIIIALKINALNEIIFWYALSLLVPIIIIFINFIFLRGNIVRNSFDLFEETGENFSDIKNIFEEFYKEIKKSHYIKIPQQIIKNLENISIVITVLNVISFLFIIYFATH